MRNELRFLSEALVYVVDQSNQETEASLRDLSEHGLSLKSENYINVEPNSSYVVAIIPEKEANVGKFELEIESKWVKMNKLHMESGFSVVVSFGEKEFKDYLDYLNQKGEIEPSTEPHTDSGQQERDLSSAHSSGVDLSPPDKTGNS